MRIFRMSKLSSVARIAALSVLGFCLLFSGTANASLFMKFDKIIGGSTDKKYANWINVTDVEWGVTVKASPGSATGGASSGSPVFSDLKWDQVIDRSFTYLFSDIASGKNISKAEIDFTKSGRDGEEKYFDMIFDDVLLTNLTLNGTSTNPSTVSGSFAYGRIMMDYYVINPNGTTTRISASYDVKKNKGSLSALANLYALGSSGPSAATPTPLPSALYLFGPGLVGLLGLKRKFIG